MKDGDFIINTCELSDFKIGNAYKIYKDPKYKLLYVCDELGFPNFLSVGIINKFETEKKFTRNERIEEILR